MGFFDFLSGAGERKELVNRVGDLERQVTNLNGEVKHLNGEVKDLYGRVETVENSVRELLKFGEELLKTRITTETTAKSMVDFKKSLEGCRLAIAKLVQAVNSATLKEQAAEMQDSLERRERYVDRRLMN